LNDLLDEEYPYDGKLLYSQALYRMYYEDYEIQLKSFLDEQEPLDEEEGAAIIQNLRIAD
jgi:hypothetical protein